MFKTRYATIGAYICHGARPPFAHQRLRLTSAGRVAYRLRVRARAWVPAGYLAAAVAPIRRGGGQGE